MISTSPVIKILVVTYRRPLLLKRAVASIIQQTYTNWIAEIINDDPADDSVADLIDTLADPRIRLSLPAKHRGATQNFNYAFKQQDTPYATILEDDNWFEPTYLETMLRELTDCTEAQIAVANQRIWIENKDNSWTDSQRTIWPGITGTSLYRYNLIDKCGAAKICNSSMVWRTASAANWLTPDDLPIDVTEHFRERILPHPVLLVNTPLVNYAQTLHTNRSKALIWGQYQTLLIASVFQSLPQEAAEQLAGELWALARAHNKLYKTSLLHSGFSSKSAAVLVRKATPAELFRYSLTWIKSPLMCYRTVNAPKLLSAHFKFLTELLKPHH